MANEIDRVDAITSLVGGIIMHGDEVTYVYGQTPPTEEQIQAEIIRLQAEYEAKEYQRKRKAEYPSIADQLDDIYHNGIDGWKATIKTTKDKYAKG